MRRLDRNAVFFAAGGFLAALFLAGAAHAITDTVFQYSHAQKGYINLSPLAFSTEDSGSSYDSSENFVEPGIGAVEACLGTAINLPDGAQITELAAWASSDRAAGVTVRLFRFNPANGGFAQVAFLQSTDTTQTRLPLTQAVPASAVTTVSNLHFNYSIDVCLDHDHSRFYGTRLSFTYTKAGD
jgi:hypothetical protein